MSRSPRVLLAPALVVSTLLSSAAHAEGLGAALRDREPMCANPAVAGNTKAPPAERVPCASLPPAVSAAQIVAPVPSAVDLARNVASALAYVAPR